MDLEALKILLDDQRKFVNETIDRIDRKQQEAIRSSDRKINYLITSLEFTQKTMDELAAKVTSLENEIFHPVPLMSQIKLTQTYFSGLI